MSTNGEPEPEPPYNALIGNTKNFWLYDSRTGFDLTHPNSLTSPLTHPRLTIQTTTSPITVDPRKSALVIIDMQNYFLSPALGRARGPGHDAVDQLVRYGIPAARKAVMRVIWVNWGLSQKEIDEMPPAVLRAFGFEGQRGGGESIALDKHGQRKYQGGDKLLEDGKDRRRYKGVGSEMGPVIDPQSGEEIDAGRILMRDQWNTGLVPPLDGVFEEGRKLEMRPDVWVHKNRMSGAWGKTTALVEFLEKCGITTCFFGGVNTDQCVAGTFMDCFSKGYDCILLNDGCGTTTPSFAQQFSLGYHLVGLRLEQLRIASSRGCIAATTAASAQSKKRPSGLVEQELEANVARKRARLEGGDNEIIELSSDEEDNNAQNADGDNNSDGSYAPPSPEVANTNSHFLTPQKPTPKKTSTTPHTSTAKKAALTPQKSNPKKTAPTPQKPAATPSKPTPQNAALHNLPSLADRYIPQTSTATGISYTDPRKFGVKPAYWESWTAKQYRLFGEFLRQSIDLIPFAREIDRPVEEVKHVFNSLVVNPLYDVQEARLRGKEGMEEIFELFDKFGTPCRFWGKAKEGVQRMKGQLDRVSGGKVHVVLESGLRSKFGVGSLGVEDVKYLKATLTEEDRRVLWDDGGEVEV